MSEEKLRLTLDEAAELVNLRIQLSRANRRLETLDKGLMNVPPVSKKGRKMPSRRMPMLNTTQIAYLLGVSRQMVNTYLSSGQLRSAHALVVRDFMAARFHGPRTERQRAELKAYEAERVELAKKLKNDK